MISWRARVMNTVRAANAFMARALYWPCLVRFRLSRKRRLRQLHVGCGKNRLQGWINADLSLGVDMVVLLEKRLPFRDDSLSFIYSEHVVEHVDYTTAVRFFKEALRTLEPGGVIRTAMPDLDDLVDGYIHDWKRFDWVGWPQFSFIRTRAEMINIAFRWWGHRHLYNREELERALREAGFTDIRFPERGHSSHPALQGLETRPDSLLIAEATKP